MQAMLKNIPKLVKCINPKFQRGRSTRGGIKIKKSSLGSHTNTAEKSQTKRKILKRTYNRK